jgi:hypothetical protein
MLNTLALNRGGKLKAHILAPASQKGQPRRGKRQLAPESSFSEQPLFIIPDAAERSCSPAMSRQSSPPRHRPTQRPGGRWGITQVPRRRFPNPTTTDETEPRRPRTSSKQPVSKKHGSREPAGRVPTHEHPDRDPDCRIASPTQQTESSWTEERHHRVNKESIRCDGPRSIKPVGVTSLHRPMSRSLADHRPNGPNRSDRTIWCQIIGKRNGPI